MEDTHDTRGASLRHHRPRIVLSIACVNNYRNGEFSRERQLLRECASLLQPWRVVVMVIETALTDRHRSRIYELTKARDVAGRVET